jgi:hypothetical protein
MAYRTIYTEVEVEVDMDDFSDEDLLEELESRNIQADGWDNPENTKELVYKMYEKKRLNQNIDEELREFFWRTIGRSL